MAFIIASNPKKGPLAATDSPRTGWVEAETPGDALTVGRFLKAFTPTDKIHAPVTTPMPEKTHWRSPQRVSNKWTTSSNRNRPVPVEAGAKASTVARYPVLLQPPTV